MQSMTSVEAQSRFGELIDRAQREPIALTRHGRVVAYDISEHDSDSMPKSHIVAPRLSDGTRITAPSRSECRCQHCHAKRRGYRQNGS